MKRKKSHKVFSLNNLLKTIKKLKAENKTLVLVGGCFDVLHPGHVIFLQKAKQQGDYLIVLLESDEKIKLLKGSDRPVHSQEERGLILSALEVVDFIVLLPNVNSDQEYNQIIGRIQPNIIAATLGDSGIDHKKRVAKITGAKVKYVTKIIGKYSTTNILNR